MQGLMLLVFEFQFVAAIQSLYRESGTTISLLEDVFSNAFTLSSVSTGVECLKSNVSQLLHPLNVEAPMLVIPFPTVMLTIFVQF